MTKQELYDEVNRRIDSLNKTIENPPKEYKFYADFVKNYKLKNINEIIKIPYIELVIALLYSVFEVREDFNDFYNNINKARFIYEELNADEISDMSHFFLGFINASRSKILVDIFNDTNKKRAANEIKRVFEHSTNIEDAEDAYHHIEKVLMNNGKYGWDASGLIEYYKKYGFDSNFIDNVLNANVTNYNQVYDNYLRLVRKKIKYLNLSTFSFL